MIFIVFGLTVAAATALVLGMLSPRLVPVPPPATRGLVIMIYGSFLIAGGIVVGTMTREVWAPAPPVAVAVPMAPATPPPTPEPPLPEPAPAAPDPAPVPVAPEPVPVPVPASPVPLTPAPMPLPDPGPPPEPPTRFGPKALGQSAVHLRRTLTDQGLVPIWEEQRGPLGQAVSLGRGGGVALLAEAEDDRLYRVQATTDLGSALADLGPVARDTARLQLGLTALALAPISPDGEGLRRESDRIWGGLLAKLQDAPDQPRASETVSIAGAALRLTLTQGGKASAQLAGGETDLDPLLDAGPQ